MEKYRLTIDSVEVEAWPGETILNVARRYGMGNRIPTLCYDPDLPPYTSCYLCVVEQEGVGKLLPACSAPAAPGAVIHTRSERVLAARRTGLELLLSNHPADCVAPCSRGCPAGVDVQRYLALASVGEFEAAVKTIRERNPLPIVCGRVCVRKCEDVCRRRLLDAAVGINMVKRSVSDWWLEHPYEQKPGADTGKKVAVVGGGPSGLSAAYFLRLAGHAVTIFEQQEKLGGMLRWGIPDYRLPQRLLDIEISRIVELGIEVRTGVKLGRDVQLADLRKEFGAVYLALGAQLGVAARIKGEDHPAVHSGVKFLAGVKRGVDFGLKGLKVAIVGGGNTAIDAARTALRLGAREVVLLYRRTRAEMPANEEEIEAAEEEGVRLEYLTAPVEVKANGEKLAGLICTKMELGEPDSSGRRRPIPVVGSEHLVACDVVIAAIGQKVDLEGVKESIGEGGLRVSRWGTVEADPFSCATSIPGVFAGGDCTVGPAVVIEAVAWGRRAALSIHQYLETGKVARELEPFTSRRENYGEVTASDLPPVDAVPRSRLRSLPPGERTRTFEEVELSLEPEQTRVETLRCLRCGCPAEADCELRRLATEYGLDHKVAGSAIVRKVDRSHPSIVLDPNKCILCTKCVRTCGEIMGISVLGLVNRGFETIVAPTMGRPLAETDCISCGNCVEACPTGALSFKARASHGRFLEQVETACALCGELCPVTITRNEFGYWVHCSTDSKGRRSVLCELGRTGNVKLLEGERLTVPLVRQGKKLVEVGWDQALDAAVSGLKALLARGDSGHLLVSGGPELTCEEASWLAYLGHNGLGANVGSLSLLPDVSELYALDQLYGRTSSSVTDAQLDRAACVLVVGKDPAESNPVTAARLRRARRNGAKVVSVTSAKTAVTRISDVTCQVRPGASLLLLTYFLRKAVEKSERGKELGALLNGLPNVDLETLENQCGLGRREIHNALELLTSVTGPIVAIYGTNSITQHSPDDLLTAAKLVEVLSRGDEGSGIMLVRHGANIDGLRLASLLPSAIGPALQLKSLVESGKITGAWIVRDDPSQLGDFTSRLAKLAFLVVQDVTMTPTAQQADVVLPASTHLETGGTFIASDLRVIRTQPCAACRVERTTIEVLKEATARLGATVPESVLPQELSDILNSQVTHVPSPLHRH